MDLSLRNFLFPKKDNFSEGKLHLHEEHQRKVGWVYYCTFVLGMWLLAGPATFDYTVKWMVWNDLIVGALIVILSIFAMKPYNLWAQWSLVILGIWLLMAPMIFFTESGAGFMTDFIIGTLVVSFAIIIPRQPGIKLFAQAGPNVPPGWTYNPSSWNQRVPVIFFAWIGFFVARYMGAFQLGIIDTVWDPFFGSGTKNVLTSDVSESFPVSDATLGAFSYIMDVLFAYAGGTHRWRTMPWVVIIFGILIIPLGVVSITLVILQPVSVGSWCTLCLTSAMISLIMIPFTIDEVLATLQMMRYEKKERRTSYIKSFFFGGTMEGGEMQEKKDPATLLPETIKESFRDLLNRPWNLFIIMALGIGLMIAPGLFGFSGSITDNYHLTGALVVTFAVISMSEIGRPARFLYILFGIWLITAPFIMVAEGLGIWISVIAGVVLIPLCLPKGKIEDKHGAFDKYIV